MWEAAQCLRHTGEFLRGLPQVLSDVDVLTHQGHACVTPESAQQTLSSGRGRSWRSWPNPSREWISSRCAEHVPSRSASHRPALRSEAVGGEDESEAVHLGAVLGAEVFLWLFSRWKVRRDALFARRSDDVMAQRGCVFVTSGARV